MKNSFMVDYEARRCKEKGQTAVFKGNTTAEDIAVSLHQAVVEGLYDEEDESICFSEDYFDVIGQNQNSKN